jgi:hypothetical protein
MLQQHSQTLLRAIKTVKQSLIQERFFFLFSNLSHLNMIPPILSKLQVLTPPCNSVKPSHATFLDTRFPIISSIPRIGLPKPQENGSNVVQLLHVLKVVPRSALEELWKVRIFWGKSANVVIQRPKHVVSKDNIRRQRGVHSSGEMLMVVIDGITEGTRLLIPLRWGSSSWDWIWKCFTRRLKNKRWCVDSCVRDTKGRVRYGMSYASVWWPKSTPAMNSLMDRSEISDVDDPARRCKSGR